MKLSQDICVPKSCNNKQTGLCLLDVYLLSLMWSQIRESWTRNGGGPWRRGCKAFLCAVPGSSKPYTARSHQYNILYVRWFVCLDMWNIWISRPKVQMACRAHVQIKTTGAQGIESALGEMSPNYMVLDNVTLAGEKVWTNGNIEDNLYKRILRNLHGSFRKTQERDCIISKPCI